jgi:hypothetical protein
MKVVPSDTDLRNYSSVLYDLFGQDTGIRPDRIRTACCYVIDSSDFDVDFLLQIVAPAGSEIELRSQSIPGYPYPQHIAELCLQFESYRQSSFREYTERISYVLWSLGALYRCIKPFNVSNAIVGHLIENDARQRYGLPWRLMPLSPEKFRLYKNEVFSKHYAELIVPANSKTGA